MLKIFHTIILVYIALLLPGCATSVKNQSTPISDIFELKRAIGGIGI